MQNPRLAVTLPRTASTVRSSSLRPCSTHLRLVPATPSHLHRRSYTVLGSTEVDKSGGRWKGPKISHLFGGLALMGMFVTTYGLLEWYFAFSTWPPEVRDDLKRAIKARNRGDVGASEKLFQSAIDKARNMPLSELGKDPLLKITGLYITLSAMHESAGQPRKAFRTLSTGLDFLDSQAKEQAGGKLDLADQSRSVALSQKMGHLALVASEPRGVSRRFERGVKREGVDKEWEGLAEKYLTRALEGMIELGSGGASSASGETKVVGRDFVFPDEQAQASGSSSSASSDKGDREISGESIAKVTRKSMGLTMESLADLYARQGRFDRANPLYVQAISTLLPPDTPETKSVVDPVDRCQAAMLINTLSSSLLNPPTSKNITASKAWSLRSLQLVDRVLEEESGGLSTGAKGLCERARIVGEFNMGALLEMENDVKGAIKYIRQSEKHSRTSGFRDGVREAGEALDRLGAGNSSSTGKM